MDSPVPLAASWVVYAGLCGVLWLVGLATVRWLRSREDSDTASTATAWYVLTLALCTAALPALDVYLVSATTNPTTGLKYAWATPAVVHQLVTTVAYAHGGLLATMALALFVLVPFVYFYYEEDDAETSAGSRLAAAVKYTLFTALIALVVLATGFIFQARRADPDAPDWFRRLLTETALTRAALFGYGTLVLLGTVGYVFYTSLGLSLVPLNLTRVQPSPAARHNIHRTERELEVNRQMQRTLARRYENVRVPVSARDRKLLEEFRKHEAALLVELEACHRASRRSLLFPCSGSACMEAVCRPVRVLLGCVLIAVSWAVVLSVALNALAQMRHSVCGADCGYYFDQALLANPVAVVLVRLADLSPADVGGLLGLSGLLTLCTLVALVYRGVGLLGLWQFYPLTPGGTAPQALLHFASAAALAVPALNHHLATHIAPQYLAYGSQRFCNATTLPPVESIMTSTTPFTVSLPDCGDQPDLIVPCDVRAPHHLCTPTALSTLAHSLGANFPTLGDALFYAQLVFLVFYILGFAVFLVKACHGTLSIADTPSATAAEANREDDELRAETQAASPARYRYSTASTSSSGERRPLLTA
ncbi:hypothetical protein IWQ60_001978 [Tieghemiomyces parasiticus]|uniref:Lysosomal cobalamin transporter n=1 Tax=Tieghemiomyces parasiticus TaxID=78921 RepID=A0A9W8AFN1_9FUNG|nr:hypothetical protein IWQ60_001978 [Tieghemiomyces parasiticus]